MKTNLSKKAKIILTCLGLVVCALVCGAIIFMVYANHKKQLVVANVDMADYEENASLVDYIVCDWRFENGSDTICVFSKDKKRGYYNSITRQVVVWPQYDHAWIFSEGLAAVAHNDTVGFIDKTGRVVIDFQYSAQIDYVFHSGFCKVCNFEGKCGLINKQNKLIIPFEYDDIQVFGDYILAYTNNDFTLEFDTAGNLLNSHVICNLEKLTYPVYTLGPNGDYVRSNIPTDYYIYEAGNGYYATLYGLMDANGNFLTKPIYTRIISFRKDRFRAILSDNHSEVIINTKGEVVIQTK